MKMKIGLAIGLALIVIATLTVNVVYADEINAKINELNPYQTVGTTDNSSIQTIGNSESGNSDIVIGHK
jgi:hypothetical protein